MATVLLGHVRLPEGILVILDPGLGRLWRHDGDPASPRKSDPPQTDLRIVGPDAEAAGRAYDRSFDPLHLCDISDAAVAIDRFAEFCTERGLDARAEPTPQRIPHTERVSHALAAGEGLGVVAYNGLWAVVAGDLPNDRDLPVVGTLMPDGEFGGRFAHIDIVVQDGEATDGDRVAGVMVDHGQLMFAGLGPLGAFRVWESLDGLADFVFWGRDAKRVADRFGAGSLDDTHFGWVDVPVEEVGGKAGPVQRYVADEKLAVGIDYRPHCNLERFNALMRSSEADTAQLDLAGAATVACGNRWGDGIFSVERRRAADGSIAAIRVELATEQRMAQMGRLRRLSRGAVVSKKILVDGEPPRFADRDEPRDGSDSGWSFFAGTETDAYARDPSNFAIVSLAAVLEREPALEPILEAPPGSKFHRDGDGFVPG